MAKKAKKKAKKASKKKASKKTAKKASKKKARRTVLYSSKGKKLYAKRDAGGKFKDIQQYSKAHAADIKRGAKSEAAAESAPAQAGDGAAPTA
jgi:DNA-binding protein HU-beta